MGKTLMFAARVLIAAMLSFGSGLAVAIVLVLLLPYLPYSVVGVMVWHQGWPTVAVLWALILWINGRLIDYTARWMPA